MRTPDMTQDFVFIIEQFAGFIQNERIGSYNEGVDMILENARMWMAANGIGAKQGDHVGIPDLLDQVRSHYQAAHSADQ